MITSPSNFKFDEIGNWSEVKLEIIKKYASAYSTILTSKGFWHTYVDGFSGAGIHVLKETGEQVPGSPSIALSVHPPFDEYHFVDLNAGKTEYLRSLVGDKPNVHIYNGDCNIELLHNILPRIQFRDYRRGLCLLDPYGLHLNWEVIFTAGQMKTIDLFLNFPVADMNRNVIWRNPEGVSPNDIARMNAFWGDESWRTVAYTTESDLFGHAYKTDNEAIVKGFRERLVNIAGFASVPKPLPMKNSKGAVVYYLFFASPNDTANKIVNDIFNKYR